MAGLHVEKVNLMRRRLDIALAWNTPKNHERRTVPLPRFLVDELGEHLHRKRRDDLVFPGRGA